MAEQSRPAPAEAFAALEAERDIYARVLELSRKGRELAAAARSEELLAVLAEKGQLSDQAGAVAEKTRELKAGWNQLSAALDPDQRARGGRLLAEIRELLGKTIAEDDECRKLLAGRRDGALEEMLRVQQGRRMNQAYGRKPPASPKFKDEQK